MITTSGYQHTFIVWGIVQGVVVLACSLFLARPPVGWAPPNWKEKEKKIKARINTSAVDMTPFQMLRQPSFYLIYVMMVMLAFGGLVVTAQLKPMAVSYHVDKVIVVFGMSALVLAIEVDRILNGLTRPFWGWVSDHVGRENAIFASFVLEAIAVFALLQLISHPLWFIALSGPCFHLSPATCTETNGPPPTMESSTPPRDWRRFLPVLAPLGYSPRPDHGQKFSGL
jgi:OFA family oxalate/formate antiporter-like MFS transporter